MAAQVGEKDVVAEGEREKRGVLPLAGAAPLPVEEEDRRTPRRISGRSERGRELDRIEGAAGVSELLDDRGGAPQRREELPLPVRRRAEAHG